LATEPDQDVISSIVIDSVGDCILPSLTVDKKGEPVIEEWPQQSGGTSIKDSTSSIVPVFKFTHSAGLRVPVTQEGKQRTVGAAILGVAAGPGAPNPTVASYLVRQVTLINENACNLLCRFRTEGPFRVREIHQVGQMPARPCVIEEGAMSQSKHEVIEEKLLTCSAPTEVFQMAKRETLTLHVEFLPELVPITSWSDAIQHTFHGDLYVEYPRGPASTAVRFDSQRIHLVAMSRRPSIRLAIVPHPLFNSSYQSKSQPGEKDPPVHVEFGYAHVEGTIARTRFVTLSNETSIPACWRLVHVGQKHSQKTNSWANLL